MAAGTGVEKILSPPGCPHTILKANIVTESGQTATDIFLQEFALTALRVVIGEERVSDVKLQ